jgi:RNA polymerase sigma factor (sigma-70 family)
MTAGADVVDDETLRVWFVREVLPLERSLTLFIRKYCRFDSEVLDRRQEIYERVLLGGRASLPLQAAPFVFSVARNHLINCAKRARIISFELFADLEGVTSATETLTPERHIDAREEVRRLMLGLEQLPARCREVVWLRKVECLSTREVAERMGVTVSTVEQQTTRGMRALVDFMSGGTGKVKRGGAPEHTDQSIVG